MSIIDSTVPERNSNTIDKPYLPTLLSLNDVLRESLKKVQAKVDNLQLIVRCENLPQIKTSSGDLPTLFDDLLGMILNHPPTSSKLFLYIDCEEETTDLIDMPLEEGFKRYIIKFFTNVHTHENWKLVNSQTLVNCRQILSNHNGTLVVNDISSTGCLFSVTLPGKFE
jgi:light-regulated signal transduction histidine kinase (bacteriophytochrome)